MAQASYRPQTLVVPPEKAEEYLADLGISSTAVVNAIERGDQRAAMIGPFYPRTAAGLTRWMEVVAVVREHLVTEEDWSHNDYLNRPTCVSKDKQVILSVVGGDEAAGDAEVAQGPRAAHRRGGATAEAFNGQLELELVMDITTKAADTPLTLTDPPPEGQWVLIYHRREEGVWFEVSKPAGVTEGQFTGWLVRVILDPFVPEPTPGSSKPRDVGGDDVDFTILEA